MKIRSLGIFLGVMIACVAAQEPAKPNLTPTIITATRQVTLFTRLEKQLLQAVQKKDKAAVEAITTDDFEIAMPNADPLAGVDWEDSVMAPAFALKSFAIRQMSVADLGDAVVVKFMRVQQASYKGKDASGDFFVVDLWKKSGDSWKLANRYVAKVGPAPAKVAPKPSGKQ
jgi:ketosteroid isomerase-like protein